MTEPLCGCGHPLTMHQTGEGPWTGFCYGTLGNIVDQDYAAAVISTGADASEPCDCEKPEPLPEDRDPIEVYGTAEHEAWLIEMERQEG